MELKVPLVCRMFRIKNLDQANLPPENNNFMIIITNFLLFPLKDPCAHYKIGYDINIAFEVFSFILIEIKL